MITGGALQFHDEPVHRTAVGVLYIAVADDGVDVVFNQAGICLVY